METSKKLLIRFAVKLAAAHNQRYETLIDAVLNVLYGNTPFPVDSKEIEMQIKYDTSAILFFDYGIENPNRIKNIGMVKNSLAEMWFLTYISRKYDSITFLELKNLMSDKFQLEKKLDVKLTEVKYLDRLKKAISSTDDLRECGQVLFTISHFADEALKNMYKYFECVLDDKRFLEIYPMDKLEQKQMHETSVIKKTVPLNTAKLEETIKSLRSDKLFLETKIHKLEVDMKHMKQDIIRDVMSDLTNPAYGYPLSELYLYTQDKQIPESVRGTIKNLFTTFGNAGIRLLKTNEIGENFIYDEVVSKKYDIYKYHEFKIGDEVFVCYPGYRYDKETVVKPIVKRKDV